MYIKFVIWGLGVRGKKMLLYMPHDRIVAFIDSDESLLGQCIDGIPVISLEEYKKNNMNYPIIITPVLYQDDIKGILEKNNIYNGLAFSFDIESWFMQIDKNKLLDGYDKQQLFVIYGYTVIGLLLYEYFFNKGVERCELYLEDKNTQKYIEQDLQMNIYKNSKYNIIFTTQKNTGLLDYDQGSLNSIEMYDLSIRKDLFENRHLTKFKDIHLNKRIFLVATGPSLNIADLDKLYQYQEYCMSFNGIFHAFDKTKWRPDYYNVNDLMASQRWKNNIIDLQCEAKFVADVAWYYEKKDKIKNLYRYHLYRKDLQSKNGDSDFSYNFAEGVYGGTTVVYSGIQMAIYMGFKEIYLLGTDCNYSFSDKSTHFYMDSKEERSNKAQEREGFRMIQDYEMAKKYADKCGVKIYNATRGGMLEVFERVDFDLLFY